MITYNHEKYMAQAIEGVLAQKTNFPYRLIIGEDNSTDGTRVICEHYAQKFQSKIYLLPSDKNLGMMPNFVKTLQACESKYIALCEGDDYWIDELKLQRQVDILEQNPQYSICFHDVKMFDEASNGFMDDHIPRKVPRITSVADLAEGNYLHTPSVLFRNWNMDQLPAWFVSVPYGDYALHCLTALYGDIVKIDGLMSVYRVHHASMMSRYKKLTRKDNIHFFSGLINLYLHIYAKTKLVAFKKNAIRTMLKLCKNRFLTGERVQSILGLIKVTKLVVAR